MKIIFKEYRIFISIIFYNIIFKKDIPIELIDPSYKFSVTFILGPLHSTSEIILPSFKIYIFISKNFRFSKFFLGEGALNYQ